MKLFLLVALTIVLGSMAKPSKGLSSKFFGTYEGKLQSYALIIGGKQTEIKEAEFSVEISKNEVLCKVMSEKEPFECSYSFTIDEPSKTQVVLILQEKDMKRGELKLFNKGKTAILSKSLFGSEVNLVKAKKK